MLKNFNKLFFGLVLLCICQVAFAAGGISKVDSFLNLVSSVLYGVGAVVMAIAIMWAGFKIMFQGQTLREAAPPLLGGLLIASASAISGYLIA